MPPTSKKTSLSSRFVSFLRGRGGESTVDSRQGSAEVANPGGGADHASTRSVPIFSFPVDSSTVQYHESQPPLRHSRSKDYIVEQLQSAALSTPNNEGVLQHPPISSLQSHGNPPVSGAYDGPTPFLPSTSGRSEPSWSDRPPTRTAPDLLLPAGSPTPQYHGYLPPIYPSRSKNNIGESSHPAGLSMPRNDNLLRQHSPSPLPSLQSYDHPSASGAHGGATAFFPGASGFQVGEFKVVNVNSAGDRSIDGWELLMGRTAPNALHNSRARFDAPKCDEDTRVEVTSELMEWIEDRNGPQRLMCMTGAAGSGKSCLQQTAAEKCGRSNILGASFFLSAADPTRNTVDPVIPTIAYQLGRGNPTLKWSIKTAIERDPLIFDQSLEAQITALIVRPVEDLRDMETDLRSLPYVILIDGLDEGRGEDRQAELLTAIRRCLLVGDLPFRIFVASRPEWAIHSALQPGGHLRDMTYHIQLSNKYDATADMRRYLRRRFEDIGLRINDPNWFSEEDIETLVQAGSGQFIYVATVYKYISERRASPAARLNTVLTWTPHAGQVARPFEGLDVLYYNILLAAKNAYESIDTHRGRDFLLLFRSQHINTSRFTVSGISFLVFATDLLSALLVLEPRAEEALISDLRSLVALETDSNAKLCLRLYHKSFSDFLGEPSRAKDLFIPESRVYTHLAKSFMQHIIECPLNFDSLPAKWEELPLSKLHRNSLQHAVEDLPFFLGSFKTALDDDEVVGFTQNGGLHRVDKILPLLYSSSKWFRMSEVFGPWISHLQTISDRLKGRKPETVAVINAFAKKWRDDWNRWKESRKPEYESDSDFSE